MHSTMTKVPWFFGLSTLLLLEIHAFTHYQLPKHNENAIISMTKGNEECSRRRKILENLIVSGAIVIGSAPSLAVERAVGGAEKACRERGDCLERFELDGAVGWSWGGKERCDSTDARCGPDGILRDAPPSGEPVPEIVSPITNIIEMTCTIGKNETGTLKLGLYGEACPNSVSQFAAFMSLPGLVTENKLMLEDGYGVASAPVTMARGYGLLDAVVPQQRLAFGIPSQAAAYAKSKGKAKAGDNFRPQPRPNKEAVRGEQSARKHDTAGLLSIPRDGLGYADNSNDDEAFSLAYEITATSVQAMDKEGRKAIGQVLDAKSMTFLLV
jgi:hypothetical protein